MMLERTLCGVDVTRDFRKTKATPHRHPCRCSRQYSSNPICHRCACVACAAARAEWAKFIAAGGMLGAQQRERATTARRKHAK